MDSLYQPIFWLYKNVFVSAGGGETINWDIFLCLVVTGVFIHLPLWNPFISDVCSRLVIDMNSNHLLDQTADTEFNSHAWEKAKLGNIT